MTIFQVRVKKLHTVSLIDWENRYYVQGSDMASANAAALTGIVDGELALHNSVVKIVQLITSDIAPGGDFISNTLDSTCENGVAGDELPAILTLNCVFNTQGFGHPDRKYYHVFWGETGQAAGKWSETPLAAAQVVLASMITEMHDTERVPLCDIDGNEWTIGVALEKVGAHKFSKRSKRRAP